MKLHTKILVLTAMLVMVLWASCELRKMSPDAPKAVSDAVPTPYHGTTDAPPLVANVTSNQAKERRAKPKDEPSDIVEFRVVEGLAVAQGDIILGVPEDPKVVEGYFKISPPNRWDQPEIPYAIADDLPHPERVQDALDYLKETTPLRFVAYEEGNDGILFEKGNDHCLSLLGRRGGLQPIRLANGCDTQAILHEILHALGFIHEHSRPDRDQYIELVTENIDPKYVHQFMMLAPEIAENSIRTPFDYQSIMLYPPQAFSKNKVAPTLKSRTPSSVAPSVRGLSQVDIDRIRQLFGY